MGVAVTSLQEPRPLGRGRAPLSGVGVRMGDAAGRIPPSGLALLSILSVQLGAAWAKGLFHALGPGGTVFLRIVFAALLLLAAWRPRLRGYARADYLAVILFGLTIAWMNAAFYAALARLPLGIAVTLEFAGPLAIAVAHSRRRLDLLWVGLAAGGIVGLAPFGGATLDWLGVALALLAGAGWAAYILLNIRVGAAFPGSSGLALAMGVSALAAIPLGVGGAGPALRDPALLLAGAGVALLSTAIPFSLEHAALKRLPARAYGILMSMEPAIAALIGLGLLGERLGPRSVLALIGVSLAAVGSARWGTGERDT